MKVGGRGWEIGLLGEFTGGWGSMASQRIDCAEVSQCGEKVGGWFGGETGVFFLGCSIKFTF